MGVCKWCAYAQTVCVQVEHVCGTHIGREASCGQGAG